MKILFVHPGLSSFIERDLQILRSAHEVHPIQFTGRRGYTRYLLRDLWHLWKGILWCDLSFSWFGKLHAFFAVLFSRIVDKKAVVVVGGDDTFKFVYNHQSYGLLSHPLKKWFVYFICRYADCALAVSKVSFKDVIHNAKAAPQTTKLIYHGFDYGIFKKQADVEKEKLVVTVGRITDENYTLKGLGLFVETASLFPDIPFVLVGPALDGSIERLKAMAGPNVTFTGWAEREQLVDILSKATVYVQGSIHEAFGCAIAEAMLCECVPVVANRTAMPEVVGECGVYINHLDRQHLADAIREALNKPEMGKWARKRIIEHFPLEKRKAELLEAVESLCPRS